MTAPRRECSDDAASDGGSDEGGERRTHAARRRRQRPAEVELASSRDSSRRGLGRCAACRRGRPISAFRPTCLWRSVSWTSYCVRGKCWPLAVALAEGPKTRQQLYKINANSEKTLDLLCEKLVSGNRAREVGTEIRPGAVDARDSVRAPGRRLWRRLSHRERGRRYRQSPGIRSGVAVAAPSAGFPGVARSEGRVRAPAPPRMIENAARHVPFREVFLLFGQGILERDRCLKTLELFAEKVIPRFR